MLSVVSASQVGDEESREQLIKTHYMVRVGELTTQLQISDSKAVHFHSEVKTPNHPPNSRVYLTNCFFWHITDLVTPSEAAAHLKGDTETQKTPHSSYS